LSENDENDALKKGVVLASQYQISSVLGQGGFGITYLARDLNLDQNVAVKEFLPENIAVREDDGSVKPKTSAVASQYNAFKKRFLDEARAIAKFKHPNMVRIQNYFEAGGTAYFVMEYEEGEGLDARLKRVGRIDEQAALDIALPILNGLSVMHKAGMIHRDIKPANIYIREDGSPVLLDFGAARAGIDSDKTTMTSMLTPGYAPIEQYYTDAKQQGSWSDIYAMAGVIYRCVSGRRIVEASKRSAARLRGESDPLKPASSMQKLGFSKAFLSAIDHALMVLGEERPATVKEWQKELTGEIHAAEPELPEDDINSEDEDNPRTSADLSMMSLDDFITDDIRSGAKKKAKKATEKSHKKDLKPKNKSSKKDLNKSKKTAESSQGKTKTAVPMLVALLIVIAGGLAYWKFEIYDKQQFWVDPVTGMSFAYVPGGCYTMGSKQSEAGRYDDEHSHQVCVDGFWMSRFETKQKTWKKIMGDNPSAFKRLGKYPVERVSYRDVKIFISKLNKKGKTSFRLPTEAEWEYAARGGKQTAYYWGKKAGSKKANCGECRTRWSNISPAPVGSFAPNAYKLYDMLGNLFEWTCSPVNPSYDGSEKRCVTGKSNRVVRGGSWAGAAQDIRAAYRFDQAQNYRHNTIGFRLIRHK
jgi:formylglycine-generating enzyme required for sulfatase activity